jgi:ferric-dicitrate binding protein FerR (iron transport regulator)
LSATPSSSPWKALGLRALVAAALAATSACGLLGDEPPPSAPDAGSALGSPVAHLEQTRGSVVLERGGKMGAAKLGSYLYLKDALITAAEASATVRFQQGQEVEIGPDARVVIGQDKTGIVLNVDRGLVLTRVAAGSGGGPSGATASLTILTPFGITRLGADTSTVQVEVGKEGAKVDVLVGAVELVTRNGEAQKANAGEKVVLTAGKVEIEGRTGGELTLQPLQVSVSTAGKAEVKKSGQKKWKPVGRNGEPVAEGDSVRVKSGRSTMSFKGSDTRYALEDDADVTLQKAGRAGDQERSTLDFRKGSVTLSLAPGKKHQVALSGLTLESDLGGQFGVVKTRDGYDVQAVAGDTKVSAGGKDQVLLAGQSVKVTEKGVFQVTPADRAEISIPTRSGLKVHHPGLPWAALSWSGDANSDYWVDVAFDARFEQKLLSGLVHANYVNVPIPRRGTLYWKVFQKDHATEVDKGSATFAPEPPVKDLARLRNEVQDGADRSAIYFQDKPPAVTFTFSPEQGAAEYRVQVYKADALDRPVVDRKTSDTKLPLEAGVLAEGNYVWSVTPLDPKGAELRGGKFNKMEIVYDNSVPNLVINSPKNGEGAKAATHASGVAPVGARLYVNGKAVDLDDKNRFDLEVSPVGRPPLVIFRVSRPPASDTITVRTLRRR